MKKTYYDKLSEERYGYVMRNEESGVEISCTERYVKAWEERGFKVIREGRITLIEEK